MIFTCPHSADISRLWHHYRGKLSQSGEPWQSFTDTKVHTQALTSCYVPDILTDCSWTVGQKCFHPKASLSLSQRDKNSNRWRSEAISACYRRMKGSGQQPADLSLCRSHSAKHLRCKLNKVPPLLFTDASTICCEHLIAARRLKPQTPWELWWSK